ncbi:MAG: hypothetical protein U0R52_12705 [Solirubrobacterales bacterium]
MGSKHAVVVSYLALFVALGGTAAALQGRFSVKADDLATGAVGTRSLAERAVGTSNLKGRAVDTDQIARDSVGRDKLKEQAVDSRLIANGTVGSEDLAPLTRVPFAAGSDPPVITRVGGDPELRIAAARMGISGSTQGAAPVLFVGSGGGGGGLVLDGSAGSQSGYLRFVEGSGSAPALSDTAVLVARDNGSGKTELVVFWPGGTSEVLATQP